MNSRLQRTYPWIPGLALVFVLLLVSGCSQMQGRLYSNIVTPLTEDFNNTPVGTKKCILKHYRLKDPVSGYNVSAEWSSKDIAIAAEKAGIKNIYYMDVRTLSVLMELYRRRDIIIYGD